MTRNTFLAGGTHPLYTAKPLQDALEAMWTLLERRAEDVFKLNEYHVEACVLDEDLLSQLMALEPDFFREHFDCTEEHDPEEQAYIWVNVPDYLLGTYTRKGTYDSRGRLIENPTHTYFFSEDY